MEEHDVIDSMARTGARLLAALLAVGLMGGVPRLAAQQDTTGQVRTVTLQQAIALALTVNPQVAQATSSVDIAHAQQREAAGNWLPSVSLSTGVSRRFTNNQASYVPGQATRTTYPFGYSAGISARMTVWDFGKRVFQNKQMNASAVAADAALVNQKFQVTLQTKQAFFSALAAVDLEHSATAAIQTAQQQLDVSKAKLAAGSGVRSDTLQATVTLRQAQLQLLNAQAQRQTQEATLGRLIGVNGPVVPVADSADLALADIDTTTIRAEAVENSPAVAQARAQLRLAGAVVNVNRTAYLPVLSASFSHSYSGQGYSWVGNFALGDSTFVPSTSLSFSLSWPLFDGFVREGNLTTAIADRDAAAAAASDAQRQVNAEVTQYLAALETARLSFQTATASRAAAEEGLRVQQDRYRLGAATILEVLTAQQSVQTADVDLVNARVNYQIAKAQIEALIGRIL